MRALSHQRRVDGAQNSRKGAARPREPATTRRPTPAATKRRKLSRDKSTDRLYRRDLDELADRRYRLRPDGKGNRVYDNPRETFIAMVRSDGSVRFYDRSNLSWTWRRPLRVGIDLNDAVLRALGDDPYGYEKRRFLSSTASLRVRMRRAHLAAGYRAALTRLGRRLRQIERLRTAAARGATARRVKRLLFRLWDDCDDPRRLSGQATAHDQQPRRLAYARHARSMILGAIRRSLPKGSASAFTNNELAALNRKRRSRQRFLPYKHPTVARPARSTARHRIQNSEQ